MAEEKPVENKAQEEAKKEEQKQAKKEVVSVCTLNVRQILVALHEKALSECQGFKSGDIELTILNSAIEGAGGKDAKFYGAGQHIIAAIPKDNKGIANNKVEKKDAIPILQSYVQWFVGPDLKAKVNEKNLKPLENGAEGKVEDNHEKKEDIEKSKDDKVAGEKYEKKDETKKESTIFVPSFNLYLLTEEGEETTEENAEDKAKDDKKEVKDKNADAAKDVKGTPGEGSNQAQGWYVEYRMVIPGQKEHSITDAMKKLGADILKAVGIKFTSLFGGADGKVHTLGDLVDSLEAVFGKMDANLFEAAANEEIKKRMKGTNASAKVWDTPTILKYLKKEVGNYKSKIVPVKYALCIKVGKGDPSYKLFNEDAVANICNSAIASSEVGRGLGKRLAGFGVKGKDVILVNNYEENKNAEAAKKGEVADSIVLKQKGNYLLESILHANTLDKVLKDNFESKKIKRQNLSGIEKSAKLLQTVYENSNFNNALELLLEAGRHTAAHINLLIDKVGSKQIQANKEKIIAALRADYSGKGKASEIRDELIGVKEKTKEEEWDKKRIAGWNKKHPDDKREEGYKEKVVVKEGKPGKIEEFFKLSDDDAMKKWVDENFGKIEKTDDGEPLVQAFWKALSLLPEKEEKEPIEITFIDKDPNGLQDDKEIAKITKEDGKELELPEEPKHSGWKFTGWDPDPEKMEESGKTVSLYEESDDENNEEGDVEITFMDIDDPALQDSEDNYKEIGKTTKLEDGSIDDKEIPKIEDKEGWKFKNWEPTPEDMTESGKTFAKYEEEQQTQEGKTFDIKIVVPNIEDPDNSAEEKELATIHVIKGMYKVDELNTAKKNEELTDNDVKKRKVRNKNGKITTDENTSLDEMIKDNEEAFKSIDNIKEIEKKANAEAGVKDDQPYKFVKWDPELDVAAKSLPEEGEEVKVKAVFSNDIKAKHTELDFYIVPMKGLKDKDKHKDNTGSK